MRVLTALLTRLVGVRLNVYFVGRSAKGWCRGHESLEFEGKGERCGKPLQ
jgi:hypothetical protein